jgi:hypothetical protein
MWFRLLVLLVLLFHNLAVVDFEFLLIGLNGLIWANILHLRWHVEYFEDGIEVEVFQIQRFQYDLTEDEIDKLFLQLYFIEEICQLLLRYCALAVLLAI